MITRIITLLLGFAALFIGLGANEHCSGQEKDVWPPKPVRLASQVSGHIHPAACVTKSGKVLVIFSQSDFKDLRLTFSKDHGKTWSEPKPFEPTAKLAIYPGSLTVLQDGRVVHCWNTWFQPATSKEKSRFVQYSVSSDEGATWSEPKSLAKNPSAQSVIRHPFVELSESAWLFSLMDRTVVCNPRTSEEKPFGDGRNHGLVPIVRTAQNTFVSGAGIRSTDNGMTWEKITPFPKIGADGWRYEMIKFGDGHLLAGEVLGPGVGGEKWRYVISRDNGKSWDFEKPIVFYDPGRAIGGRACPRTVQLDKETLGTVYYDTDAKQPGGAGLFFIRVPISRLN